MSERWLPNLIFISFLGCGLIAGVFFTFSTFVMKALASLPVADGIAAMQSINRAVFGSAFLVVFLVTALTCLIVLIGAVPRWGQPGIVWLTIGSILYIAGSLFVTMGCNVPLNNALDRVVASDPDAARVWLQYVTQWSAWNHARTIASLLAMASLAVGWRLYQR